jgi:hypothetical protein
MQQASFAATSLERQAGTLSARQQTLEMELEVLRNPQHVAEQAQKMGMVVSSRPAFLRLSDGKVLGAPAAATPAEGLRIRPRPPVKPSVLNPPPIYLDAVSSGDTGAGTRGTRGAGGTDGTDSTDRNQR